MATSEPFVELNEDEESGLIAKSPLARKKYVNFQKSKE